MKRIVSIFLVMTIVLSFVPSAGATETVPENNPVTASVLVDSSFVSAFNTYFTKSLIGSLSKSFLWSMMDRAAAATRCGQFGSLAELENACSALNRYFSNPSSQFWLTWDGFMADMIELAIQGPLGSLHWKVEEHSTYGYVIMAAGTNLVFCTSTGTFPYYMPEATVDPDTGEESIDPALGGKWVRMDKVGSVYNVVNEATLDDLGAALVIAGNDLNFRKHNNKYLVIQSEWTESGIPFLYCDSKGRPYAQQLEQENWVVDDSNNYYTEDNNEDGAYDEGATEENTLIDLESNLVWFPNGTLNYIDSLIYDESTKTYYVDAHNEYDIENNTYITYNYHYEYHIDYTSITYIGQTEEYKLYELYYQLPDGRNSADLTAEELLALNTNIDVVPYIRSADNTSIRALYHFDGTIKDSSYWNYIGNMKWTKGASITYMDSGPFEGSLYLDENDHSYEIQLPSNMTTSDFTLQFRLYQSYTAAPQTDSSIYFGDTCLMQSNGDVLLDSAGTALASINTGSWQEICIMRKDDVLYFFHNGLLCGSYSCNTILSDTIRFNWGSSQQTYKYFDELRVLNYAAYDSSEGYIPTSVPFDTNLALVLPDSMTPVADEYWNITSSYENLLEPLGLEDWCGNDGNGISLSTNGAPMTGRYPIFHINTNYTDISLLDDGAAFSAIGTGTSPVGISTSVGSQPYPAYGLASYLGYYNSKSQSWNSSLSGTYTLSMVSKDGSVGSITLNAPGGINYIDFNGYRIGITSFQSTSSLNIRYFYLYITPLEFGTTNEFVYLELVEGDTTDLTAEYVTGVAPVSTDFKTPTLAVRTDLDITGYQIGGVRPSLPEKGLVWALVEGGCITSLQIYNGQAWEAVDGRIWTGSRWVPYYAYDVLLLKDLYDIIEGDPSLDYIYTQEGFWTWLQKSWGQMMGKLDQIIEALGGDTGPTSNCEHVYESEVTREPGCAEPGNRTYTCMECGHTYVELIDATGHDWTVTGHVPDVLDDAGNIVDKGYDELTCSVCEAEGRDYGNGPETTDLFDALGNLIADGISWVLDKLTQLADSLRSITEIFTGFIERMSSLAGGFPLFFGAFVALLPEDLSAVLWFAVITAVILAVWRSWSR